MNRSFTRWGLIFLFLLFFFYSITASALTTQGIYVTQSTLENTHAINYLIKRAKAVGIDTFVVDLEKPRKKYGENIHLLKENGISYVARIVVFPDGGTPTQVYSEEYWKKRYGLVQAAIGYGAQQIQLDYIRFNTKQPPSSKNAEAILKIIQWFKVQLEAQHIPLQIDVFGIASFGESKHIGHDIKLFSRFIDVLCPMVYPSHYEPFREHAVTPYQTVLGSLKLIRAQFNNNPPFKLYPYIELSNYRYPLAYEKKLDYIREQIRAVKNSGADGWYAWSPHNKYDNLFTVMSENPRSK